MAGVAFLAIAALMVRRFSAEVAPVPEKRPGVTVQGRPVFTLIGATTATGPTIDGRYPDWRRVMPASTTGP